jgi:NTP pyrophosphatase (non-canonical NTP hydrolase)
MNKLRLDWTATAAVFNDLCREAHAMAKAKGFHDVYIPINEMAKIGDTDRVLPTEYAAKMLRDAADQAQMARVVGEIGEAVEAMRHGNPPSEKIPGFSHVEEEIADTFIRLFDFCGQRGYHIGSAILHKMQHNLGRPRLHGKQS